MKYSIEEYAVNKWFLFSLFAVVIALMLQGIKLRDCQYASFLGQELNAAEEAVFECGFEMKEGQCPAKKFQQLAVHAENLRALFLERAHACSPSIVNGGLKAESSVARPGYIPPRANSKAPMTWIHWVKSWSLFQQV